MGASRPAALVALWAAGVTLSTVVSYGAVTRVASDVTDHVSAPLSQASAEKENSSEHRSASPSAAPESPEPTETSDRPGRTAGPSEDNGGGSGGTDGGHATTTPRPSSDDGGDHGGVTPSPSSDDHGDAGSQSPSPTVTKSFSSTGGSISVSCSGSTATLKTWSPASGYQTEVDKSSGSEVDVKFLSDAHTSELKVQCQDGTPVGEVNESGGSG